MPHAQRAEAVVCMATLAEEMRTARTTVHLLPRISTVGTAKRAPNVPVDNMDATRDRRRVWNAHQAQIAPSTESPV